ncbi:3-oxoacyl-[acyl-carrier-protein] synthase III C-terminal domain-containing protein [Shewanella surugensis]|uniref:Ketoacyl-ACP synthase III n=1 Tax=Shewanella surugensis TaxID=212020 RepID=A0ABT0L6V7_9GAMM|nr:3-oxoacyl-[acyl-carrier-protein] synthase III C-terminal domain-containing protein [Shewanella surugensis]MCL1123436.1 hypothetical protein [Shewanella surugensis]
MDHLNSNINIRATGIALPLNVIQSIDIDKQQSWPLGQTEKTTGVASRHYVNDETATDLALTAIHQAIENSDLLLDDIDCLISASGTMEQPIPCNAAKIHARLPFARPIPAFDINMTCLSAVKALDIAHALLSTQRYKNILIVSSEIASVGLDWSVRETGGLFGDGAAALIVSHSTQNNTRILASHFETFSEGVEMCQIRGLGTLNHPANTQGDYRPYGLFEMQGKAVFRLTTQHIQNFVDNLLAKTSYTLQDMDWVIPHQASQLGLQHIEKRLNIAPGKMINIIKHRGNQIAASIPSALHELLQSGKVKTGDKVMLLGTSAGLSFGAIVLEIG